MLILVAWWREIVVGAVLVSVGVGAIAAVRQTLWPQYESSADALIVVAPTHVSLDTTIEAARAVASNQPVHVRARRSALVGLIRNGSVARAVLERLDGLLDGKNKKMTEGRLLRSISGELVISTSATLRHGSDLIRITARADSPEKAATVADAWTAEYVRHVNQLSSRVPERLVDSLAAAAKRASQDYNAAQKALEDFVATTNIDIYPRLIESKKQIVNELQALDLVTSTASIKAHSDLLIRNYNVRSNLAQLVTAAEGLRDQIESGGEESRASTGLALALLKIGSYASDANLPNSLEIKVEGDAFDANAADQLADVNALIDTLGKQITESGQSLERLSESLYHVTAADTENVPSPLLADAAADSSTSQSEAVAIISSVSNSLEAGIINPISSFVDDLEQEILLLESQHEAVTAERILLAQERDNMLSAMGSLEKELVEMRLASAAEVPELRVAASAVVPTRRNGLPLLAIVIMAAILGLPAMACLAFMANAMYYRPFLKG